MLDLSQIMVNYYGRMRREWMVLTMKFHPLNVNLRARRPSVVLLCHSVWAHGKTHIRAFGCCCCGVAPTAALSHTVNNQVIRNLLYGISKSSKGTEEIEYGLTCAEFAMLRKT